MVLEEILSKKFVPKDIRSELLNTPAKEIKDYILSLAKFVYNNLGTLEEWEKGNPHQQEIWETQEKLDRLYQFLSTDEFDNKIKEMYALIPYQKDNYCDFKTQLADCLAP